MLHILRADSLIAAGLLLTAWAWLRKTPLPPANPALLARPPGLAARWRKIVGYLALLYPVVAAFAALWTAALWFIGVDRLASLPPAAYVVGPEPYFCVWFLPGLLLGIACGGAVADLALAAIMGRSYHQSAALWGLAAYNPHLHLRTRRFMGVMSLVLMPLALGYVTLFLPWNARFEQDRVVIHDLWAFGEQAYSYGDIDKVVAVAPGDGEDQEQVPHEEIYLFFRDGRRWCDEDYGTRTVDCRTDDAKFLAFLCEKSGRPLTRVKSGEDIAGR